MVKLIPIVSHAGLVEQIVGQFVFMYVLAEPGDSNYTQIRYELNLNIITRKAYDFFETLADENGMIMSDEVDLTTQITLFLKEWETIVDVTAIQQNVHSQLKKLDKDD